MSRATSNETDQPSYMSILKWFCHHSDIKKITSLYLKIYNPMSQFINEMIIFLF